jgi:hypothetical protein
MTDSDGTGDSFSPHHSSRVKIVSSFSIPDSQSTDELKDTYKKYHELIWSSPSQISVLVQSERLKWYQTSLWSWSHARCSPITPRNYRLHLETEIYQRVASSDRQNLPALDNVFRDENPCGANQFRKIQELMVSLKKAPSNNNMSNL